MDKSVVMAVTNDEYEFPVYITDTVPQMAEVLGVGKSMVYKAISGTCRTVNRKYKIIVVNIKEEVQR